MSVRIFYKKHERHITTIAFVAGFMVDAVTMARVDAWYDHALLIGYIVFSAAAIVFYNALESTGDRGGVFRNFLSAFIQWLPVAIQFSIGSVMSGSLVFYSKGASLSVSWPFLVLLIGLVIANELSHSRYARFALQISGLYIAAFLYASFGIPMILHRVGFTPFFIAEIVSVAFVAIIAVAVKAVAPLRFSSTLKSVSLSVAALFGIFSLLYGTNLIPPLPLTLEEIGFYYSVSRDSDRNFVMEREKSAWYEVGPFAAPYRVEAGAPLYAYSSIYAPQGLTVTVVHSWSYYDEEKRGWIDAGRIGYTISGGRDAGYRGYTVKNGIFPAWWRVDVRTADGKMIGRALVRVEKAAKPPDPEVVIR